MRSARQFNCALCHCLVQICNCCDHGNIYCSEECADIARKDSLHKANQRYQNTYRGKVMHAQRQCQYRQRRRKLLLTQEKKVTDHSCEVLPDSITLPIVLVEPDISKIIGITNEIYCHFCGCLCSSLLRRGFLQTAVIKKAVNVASCS